MDAGSRSVDDTALHTAPPPLAMPYFPTYTLGNVYAGCLNAAMRKDLPDLDDALAMGNTTPATNWLKSNLQTHGGLRKPADTIAHATGTAPSVEPLLDYLDAKFGEIYSL